MPLRTEIHNSFPDTVERLDKDCVLIAGGGPVGLFLATVLAHYGVKSVILERNETTTRWPKMDLTNVRSMELLRRLGLADDLRKLGVPSSHPYAVLISTGLNSREPITSWQFPSVDEYGEIYKNQNDGSSPVEPWLRVSQAIFEKWLKELCDKSPLVSCRYGWKVERSVETELGVEVTATDVKTGVKQKFFSKYLAACDGASSRTRRDMGIALDGGPVPGYTLLVHFKSQDLERLYKHGRFWHIFAANENGLGSAVISQDDMGIFTTHLMLPLEADHTKIDSYDAVYTALGGLGGPYKITIDEILIRSTYRHSIAIARSYRSPGGRVFLAGDSAHQNVPTGGYGMNTGLGDAFDLGWKLASVIHKYGGSALLDSYEQERRPIALQSIQRSGIHMEAHMALTSLLSPSAHIVEEDSDAGRAMRKAIHEHYQLHDGENKDVGIEMDHRHQSCIYPPLKDGAQPPSWNPRKCTPNTWPGSRAPHVFLSNGTPIFDLYGKYFTLIKFGVEGTSENGVDHLLLAAEELHVPVKVVTLIGEDNARKIWEYPLVLVRPDGHVAWRGNAIDSREHAQEVVEVMAGLRMSSPTTLVMESQVQGYNLEKMGIMQT
ncbi:FAD-binding domain-containing protein [Xylogone sp. PMI_703]|nr:FAD-binding domain-containing protein [Xylogone sp. PMI_703]